MVRSALPSGATLTSYQETAETMTAMVRAGMIDADVVCGDMQVCVSVRTDTCMCYEILQPAMWSCVHVTTRQPDLIHVGLRV